MKQLLICVLVLSATHLFAQQQPEGLRIRMDAVFNGETFCVRNEGFLFVFDRNEFFRDNLKNPDADLLATLGDTFQLDKPLEQEYNDPLYAQKARVKERMNSLLEVGRANVYTPDGRIMCDLILQLRSFRLCTRVGQEFTQRFLEPLTGNVLFTYYYRSIHAAAGCPSF
jgi:hypothetical protein